jgi:hypothetical protein
MFIQVFQYYNIIFTLSTFFLLLFEKKLSQMVHPKQALKPYGSGQARTLLALSAYLVRTEPGFLQRATLFILSVVKGGMALFWLGQGLYSQVFLKFTVSCNELEDYKGRTPRVIPMFSLRKVSVVVTCRLS